MFVQTSSKLWPDLHFSNITQSQLCSFRFTAPVPTVVRPIVYRRSCAHTCPAGGVHLAGQRFQMHFLRLLSKLKNWDELRSKAQKNLKCMYVYIFWSSHLSCWREVSRTRFSNFWPRYLLNYMSSKIAVGCVRKLKKSSKFGCVCLFLSFHLSCWREVSRTFFRNNFFMG